MTKKVPFRPMPKMTFTLEVEFTHPPSNKILIELKEAIGNAALQSLFVNTIKISHPATEEDKRNVESAK